MSQLLECYGEREGKIVREWLNPHVGFFYTAQASLYKGKTQFQEIELLQTEQFGNVLLLDGVTQVAERGDWQYHEPMTHFPLIAHPDPRDVLVIGGGDGGILRELAHYKSLEHIDFVELDEEVVAFSKQYLESVNRQAFDDPRVHMHFTDGRAFVESKPHRYDAIIMDMTDPFGPSRMLYTQEFFQAIKSVMKDDRALFVMHSESPITRPVAFECIQRTLASVFTFVRPVYTFIEMYATQWSFAVASPGTDIAALSAKEINTRIGKRELPPLNLITGETWHSMQVEYPYIKKIHEGSVPIITDEDPVFPDHFTQVELADEEQ
ncbi:MAG: polyamine aminopropyltransferase [Synergistaceae bacterium]|nr:polyamine aminopropyltransferase [Synergistaceae bacterium]MBP9958250.1 polyamine aminopropyltransferase [Synergistaceae bacterium]